MITSQDYQIQNGHLLDAVFKASNVGICVTDENGKFVRVNDAYCRIYGYDQDELMGQLFTMVVPEDNREAVWKLYLDFLSGIPELPGEWKVIRKDGELIDVHVTAALLVDREKKKFKVTTVEDLTDIKSNKEHIEFLSNYNPLTNLPNRLMFESRLKREINDQKEECQIAMLYIDIDRFKQVNDNFGFQVGDKLLESFAQRLKNIFPDDEALGYFGVDKFGVIISGNQSVSEIEALADMVRRKMREPFYIHGNTVKANCSIGISIYPDNGNTEEELLRNSEEALLQAKNEGRNICYIYNTKIGKALRRRQRIESDMKNCISRKELYLMYQPQIDILTGCIKGVEVLVRWKHPTLGMIPPAEFIPIAEESGMIGKIGDWILMETCRQIAKWENIGIHVIASVNLSPYQLRKSNFAERVLRIAGRFKVKPEKLGFELTESAIIDDFEESIEKIQTLKRYGIRFSIDDFGTGYSSMNYIRKLPLDKLKIDKSFIVNFEEDTESGLVTKTIIDMAHNLNFRVIAEGVETLEQMEFLRKSGCDEIQGYLFSRPLTKDGFLKLWFGRTGTNQPCMNDQNDLYRPIAQG